MAIALLKRNCGHGSTIFSLRQRTPRGFVCWRSMCKPPFVFPVLSYLSVDRAWAQWMTADDYVSLSIVGAITQITPTMDTYTAMQIFHPIFWVNAAGEHLVPAATMITFEDVQQGVWRVDPAIAILLAASIAVD